MLSNCFSVSYKRNGINLAPLQCPGKWERTSLRASECKVNVRGVIHYIKTLFVYEIENKYTGLLSPTGRLLLSIL